MDHRDRLFGVMMGQRGPVGKKEGGTTHLLSGVLSH